MTQDQITEEKRKESNKHNRLLAYNDSWIYKIFRDKRLSKRDKQNVLKQLIAELKHAQKLKAQVQL